MAEPTVDEKKVLDLFSETSKLSRDQIKEQLSQQGIEAAKVEEADPMNSLVKVGRLWEYSEGRKSKTQMYHKVNPESDPWLISFFALRQLVGYLAFLLPWILVCGNWILGDLLEVFKTNYGIQSSISYYYYTGMRNVFVGAICAIAVFLICCRGSKTYPKERWWYRTAGVFAIFVPFFPTKEASNVPMLDQMVGNLHLVFAGLMFATLAFICFFAFTKPDFEQTTPYNVSGPGKRKRNLVYRICGSGIVVSLALLFILGFASPVDNEGIKQPIHILGIPYFFLFEFTALFAFGFAWLMKGKAKWVRTGAFKE
ncbi:hypothetical protein ACFLWC_07230 [Chloroflexota bacterium]